jgi:hypothetical protein
MRVGAAGVELGEDVVEQDDRLLAEGGRSVSASIIRSATAAVRCWPPEP